MRKRMLKRGSKRRRRSEKGKNRVSKSRSMCRRREEGEEGNHE